MGKKIPYSDEIKEILGEEISDKNIQEVGKNMTQLYKKALPKEEFKSGLLSRLRNIHDIRLSGSDIISQRVSFYRYLGIALSFVCVAGGIMAFNNVRQLDMNDMQDQFALQSEEMLTFSQSSNSIHTDKEPEGIAVHKRSVGSEKAIEVVISDATSDSDKNIEKSNTASHDIKSRKEEQNLQQEQVLPSSKADTPVQNAQELSQDTKEQTKSSNQEFDYDTSLEENIAIPEASNDEGEAFFEMNADEGVMMGASMMAESFSPAEYDMGNLQEFADICTSQSGSILVDEYTCELPDGAICTLDDAFLQSQKSCEAFYSTEKSMENK